MSIYYVYTDHATGNPKGNNPYVSSHDAENLFHACNSLGLDTDWWFDLANSIRLVAGSEPSEAYLLLPRLYLDGDAKKNIEPLDKTWYDHRIDLIDSKTSGPITTSGWVFHSARAITGSDKETDPNAIYLVKFVDKRFLFARHPSFSAVSGGLLYMDDAGFNIVSATRDDSGMTYDPSVSAQFPYIATTENTYAGTPWTFAAALEVLWKSVHFLDNTGFTMSLSTQAFPTGGSYPTENPIDIRCHNHSSWDIFCDLLHSTGNEIYPKLDGTFEIHPIDQLFLQQSTLDTKNTTYNPNRNTWNVLECGQSIPEENRLPKYFGMYFQIRNRTYSSEVDNVSKFHLRGPYEHGIAAPDLAASGMIVGTGNSLVDGIVPGIPEHITSFAMSAVVVGDVLKNDTRLDSFAQAVITRLAKSREHNIDCLLDRFVPIGPNPEVEEVVYFIHPQYGPVTRYRSLSSSIGVASLPEIMHPPSLDRLVAADSADEVPETLYDTIIDHETFDEDLYVPVYAEVQEVDAGPPINRRVKLFAPLGLGEPGPPGADGAPGAPGATGPAGTPGDTVAEGYAIDITGGGVKTISLDPTEITDFAAAFQFFMHYSTDTDPSGANSPRWKTVSNYHAAKNQFWWHKNDTTWEFQDIEGFDSTKLQVFLNFAGPWTFKTIENYVGSDNQVLGHDAGTWKMKPDYRPTSLEVKVESGLLKVILHLSDGTSLQGQTAIQDYTINSVGSIELNDNTTNLESKLNYQPFGFWGFPDGSSPAASSTSDSVPLTECPS